MRSQKLFLIVRIAVLLACLPTHLQAQSIVKHKVFSFGNLADVKDKPLLFRQLEMIFQQTDVPFSLILNGDFVNAEMTQNNQTEQIEPILHLTDIVQKYPLGNLIIIPGDREWNSGQRGGEKNLDHLLSRLKSYLKEKNYTRCHLAGEKGCPGPDIYPIGEALTILAINTQWWNHPYDKPRPTDVICEGLTIES